jgi:hypothetical protein
VGKNKIGKIAVDAPNVKVWIRLGLLSMQKLIPYYRIFYYLRKGADCNDHDDL